MEISIISIGNSKGIRLSKTILEKYQLKDSLELILKEGYMIIRPTAKPRKGWEKAFKKMHENGEDKLLMPDSFEDEKF